MRGSTLVVLGAAILLLCGCGEDDPTRPDNEPTFDPLDLDGDGWQRPDDCLDEGFAWLPDEDACDDPPPLYFEPADSNGTKDFSAVFDGERLHIFHILDPGRLGEDDHETALGHASSVSMREWTTHPPVLPVAGPGHWNSTAVWAPHVFRHDGRWYMFVTGVEMDGPRPENRQRIGVFTSSDLFEWTPVDRRCDGVEGAGCVLDCTAAFTAWGSDLDWGSDCRDAFVLPVDDEWLMFVTVRQPDDVQAIALARSANLLDWEMVTWIPATRGEIAESPTAFVHDHEVRLLWTTPFGTHHLESRRPFSQAWDRATSVRETWASEILPAGEDTWFFFSVDNQLRLNLERLIFVDGRIDFTSAVTPECRIPAREIHPGDVDPVDGIDNNCDGRIDYVVPPPPDPPEDPGRSIKDPEMHMLRGRF